jgi:hypothetical protein
MDSRISAESRDYYLWKSAKLSFSSLGFTAFFLSFLTVGKADQKSLTSLISTNTSSLSGK